MSKPIFELIDNLPEKNMTTRVLHALDFIAPGEWQNTVGFKTMIREVTGETDAELIQAIGDRAVWLFNDKGEGYQRALWLYQTVDRVDAALGAAALANKVGEKIPLLGLLNRITPKIDRAQTIDLSLKLVVEVVAFCQINGIPGDSLGDFFKALGEYSGESLMRMVALVCLDGIIPFGPDFLQVVDQNLSKLSPQELEHNAAYKAIAQFIPGQTASSRLGFITDSFSGVKGWMGNLVSAKQLSRDRLTSQLRGFIDVTDDRLDYLAAFLDLSTNYYEHTGTQTLGRRLIERAAAEV
ncbi:MAG: hypothetical protein AAGG51_25440 [Cyanobacteria bacterium P01_G01_bin.54]